MPEAPPPSALAGWDGVLADLETRLADGAGTDWTPPTGLGPLPPDLRERATALAAAQQAALRAARDELERVGRELAAAARTAPSRAPEPSVYVDTVA